MAGISLIKLAFNSLVFYRRAHISVIIGTAISVMIITGTLMVGDSVESSLEESVHLRLGNTSWVLSGNDRYFQTDLAGSVRRDLDVSVCPLLQIAGIASSGGGALRVNAVNVNGITDEFKNIIPVGKDFPLPLENEAFISENLADRLALVPGDFFLLRIDKISMVPKNAPFVSDEDNQVSLRLKVGMVLGEQDLGRFNLKASQTAPYNVFVPLSFLHQKMEMESKINFLLFTEEPGIEANDLMLASEKNWTLRDMSLQIKPYDQGSRVELRSGRVFIEPAVAGAVEKVDPDAEKILTYFVNSFSFGSHLTPYSFISAGPFRYEDQAPSPGEMFVNTWLAEDLGARPGDSLRLEYYVIGPLRNLVEKSAWFRIKAIVPMNGDFADRELMPDIPGLTNAGNCSEWQTGIPVDLQKIRDKDEDYWDEWRGTPKAFISYADGKALWENRFGSATMIRFSEDADPGRQLTEILGPQDFGISISAVKEQGLEAARGGVDFSQLFMGLSFFLLAGGLTLLALLYNLHLEKRMGEAGTLRALGYTDLAVGKILVYEGFMIAVPGILIGGLLAVLYNKLVFIGLNSVWSEIVRTSVLQEKIRLSTLLTGMAVGLLITWLTIFLNIYSKLRSKPASLQRGIPDSRRYGVSGWFSAGAWIALAAVSVLLGTQILSGGSLRPAVFFTAGGLLLVSFLFFSVVILRKHRKMGSGKISLTALALDNLHRKPSRSIRIVLLFAIGTFVIVSTGLNQKDLYSGSTDKKSGTGGFLFYGETTLPVLSGLNMESSRLSYGFESQLEFVQMRKKEGDDASCLNLNRITQPRILGFKAEEFVGRFTFIKLSDDLDEDEPWTSLQKILPGNVIPAVADQTVIQWGLGLKVGDTLTYLDEHGETMKIKLVGGLANSIFQGNVLIDESHFLNHFPSSSGTHVMLVDGNFQEAGKVASELERGFRNHGLELTLAAERLAGFNEVENTYLSIFLLLGGLGMILGTVGLGISLARNMFDRRQELGLLKAIGFPDRTILSLITWEHLILLVAGTAIGAVSAFIAILPSLLSAFVDASWQTAMVILLIILVNGLIWILLVTRHYLKKKLIASLRAE
ncbi:MAG: ABC transporter permease [Cyclobacteriaceae bacterium]|nr:ABC transporter permease [Cyclobacteriaceae bacterium]